MAATQARCATPCNSTQRGVALQHLGTACSALSRTTAHPARSGACVQAGYQSLDQGFVGIIVSAFNALPETGTRVQVIAFQSVVDSDAAEEIDTTGMDSPTRRAILESSMGAHLLRLLHLHLLHLLLHQPLLRAPGYRLQALQLHEQEDACQLI